jgi:hypothetical protein
LSGLNSAGLFSSAGLLGSTGGVSVFSLPSAGGVEGVLSFVGSAGGVVAGGVTGAGVASATSGTAAISAAKMFSNDFLCLLLFIINLYP